jgi:hypothetical protein
MRNKLLIGVGIVGIGHIAWRHYQKVQAEWVCKKKRSAKKKSIIKTKNIY